MNEGEIVPENAICERNKRVTYMHGEIHVKSIMEDRNLADEE
jgi:hypothetical protein